MPCLATLATLLRAFPQQVNSAQQAIDNPPINTSTIIAELNSTAVALGAVSVNVTDLLISLAQVNASLWDPDIVAPPALVDALFSLDPLVTNATALVNASLAALDLYNNTLLCLGTPLLCSSPGSISGPCSLATPCTAAEPTCLCDGTTPCFTDSDCPSGICPFLGPTFAATREVLGVYGALPFGADAVRALLHPLSSSLEQGAVSVQQLPNTTALSLQLADLRSSVTGIPVDQYQAAITTLQVEINPASLGLGAAQASIDDVQTAVSGNLGVVRDNILSINATLENLLGEALTVGDRVSRLCNAAFAYVNGTLLQSIDELSASNMASAIASDGLVGAFNVFVRVVDAATAAINAAANSTFVDFDLNSGDLSSAIAQYSDPLYNSSIGAAGPLYFFASLASMSNMVSPSEAAGGGGVFVSPSGAPWSGHRVCLVDSCITATVVALNRAAPLSLATVTGTAQGGFSIPVSRETLTFLPFLAPIIALLLASVAALGIWGKRWQWFPACCSAVCICVTLPLVFILVSGLAFPMVMAFADGCRGGVNIASHYVHGSEHALCDRIGALVPTAYGGAGLCSLSLPEGQTLVVPLADVFDAVVGSCALQPTAVSSVWGQLSRIASTVPPLIVNATLNALLGTGNSTGALSLPDLGGATPRQPLVATLTSAGLAAGSVAAAFVESLGEQLSCGAVNAALASMTQAVCCDVLSALYSLVCAWSVIAFSMCLGGFGVSVLGCKRLPNELWGPVYETAMREDGGRAARDSSAQGVSIEMVKEWSASRRQPSSSTRRTAYSPVSTQRARGPARSASRERPQTDGAPADAPRSRSIADGVSDDPVPAAEELGSEARPAQALSVYRGRAPQALRDSTSRRGGPRSEAPPSGFELRPVSNPLRAAPASQAPTGSGSAGSATLNT